MADYMQLLKVITIIMNLSNSAIMFYNTPSKDLNSHLIRDLKNVIKDACFINVDEEGQIFQDSYKMGQTVLFDFGKKIKTLKDLPPKEDKENFTGVFVLKLIQSECIADLDGEDEIDSKNLQSEGFIRQMDICLSNETHFRIREGSTLRDYSTKNLEKGIFEILMKPSDKETTRGYNDVVSVSRLQKCQRNCYKSKETRMDYKINCTFCKMCESCGINESPNTTLIGCVEAKSISEHNWALIALNVMLFLLSSILLCKKRIFFTTDYWEFKVLSLLRLVLIVAILDPPYISDYLEICKTHAIILVSDIVLLPLDVLSILKLENFNLSNFEINYPKLKDIKLSKVTFFALFIVMFAVVANQENMNFRGKESNMCVLDSIEVIFWLGIFSTLSLSAIFVYYSETERKLLKWSVFSKIIIDILIASTKFTDEETMEISDSPWEVFIQDMVPMAVSLLVKFYEDSTSERENHYGQNTNDNHHRLPDEIQLDVVANEPRTFEPSQARTRSSASELSYEAPKP